MNKKLQIILGILILTFTSINSFAACTPEVIEQELKYGASAEKEGLYDAAALNYGSAALCSDYLKDYDNAITYELKAIELLKKANMSHGTAYLIIAKYYSKKGAGFEEEIKKYCDLGEEVLLEDIGKQLQRDKPRYSSIALNYNNLARCYKLIELTDKSCDYCKKSNEYSRKGNPDSRPFDCVYVAGCPETESNDKELGTTNPSGEGNNSLLPIIGLVVLLLITGAFFVLKKKK